METSLAVKDTDFEKIIAKIKTEKEKFVLNFLQENELKRQKNELNPYSDINKKRFQKITKEIKSVFRFFVLALGAHPDLPLPMEDFETLKEKLDKLAENETRRLSYYIFRPLGLQTDWGIYKKFGHFHRTRSPFQNNVLGGKSLFYWSNDGFDDFKPHFSIKKNEDDPFRNFYPLNYTELLWQIFKKRYPNVETENKKTEG